MDKTGNTVVQSYRRLYRAGLQAVQYSKPARFTLRNTLREAFRAEKSYDSKRLANTVRFLENAASFKGVEHKIVKNLMLVKWWRKEVLSTFRLSPSPKTMQRNIAEMEAKLRSYRDFDDTIRILNETLKLELR